jgi:hypothetical protein
MFKFIRRSIAFSLAVVACCLFVAPEMTRSTALRYLERLDGKIVADSADPKTLQAKKLISAAISQLQNDVAMAGGDDGEESVPKNKKIQDAFFADEIPAGSRGMLDTIGFPSGDATHGAEFQPIDTGAPVQVNPFIRSTATSGR